MWNLLAKPHLREAVRTPGLPFLSCLCVGKQLREVGRSLSHPALFPLLTVLRPCEQCPFPFWNGHTTEVVLKRGLDDKAFYSLFLPCVHMHSCSFICSVKEFCASDYCFCPSQSFLDKLPSAWACGEEKRRKASKLRIPADLHGNSNLLPVQNLSILWLCESIYLLHAVNLLLRKWKWVLDNHSEQLGAALVVTELKLWKKCSLDTTPWDALMCQVTTPGSCLQSVLGYFSPILKEDLWI